MGKNIDSSKNGEFAKQMSSNNSEIPDPSRWHKTSTLSDGTSLGCLGAYWYILDQNGRAISDSYHEISLDETGDYIGTRSARRERVVLYTEPDQVSCDPHRFGSSTASMPPTTNIEWIT